jgi:hypothetical protein
MNAKSKKILENKRKNDEAKTQDQQLKSAR